MEIIKKNRAELKDYFKTNVKPTEQNFKDLIDAGFNQKEDGIVKIPDGPIALQSGGSSQELLHFYKKFSDNNPIWRLAQTTGGMLGLNLSDESKSCLFIKSGEGNIGVGTMNPLGKLHVFESTGTPASANSGSIVLEHDNIGGQSSIVFRSKVNAGSDYGYINYQDDAVAGGNGEANILTIGTSNDPNDHISLMTKGNVGIGTQTPTGNLDLVLPSAHPAWNRFVVKPTTLWGDGLTTPSELGAGGTQFVTIGAGTGGIMINNPHVVWNSGNAAAAIRYGRSNGITGGRWWEAGVNAAHGYHIRLGESSALIGMEITLDGKVGIGQSNPYGKLHLYEAVGTGPNPSGGTITLEHGNIGGESSIVFKSRNNTGSDYAYMSFQDDKTLGGTAESSILTIANQNDGDDHIALMPAGSLGLGTQSPRAKFEINSKNTAGALLIFEETGTAQSPTNGSIILEHGNVGGQSSIVFKSKINAGGDYGYINYQDDKVAGGAGESNVLTIGTNNDPDDHIALMPSGFLGLGTQSPRAKFEINNKNKTTSLLIYEETGTVQSSTAGSITLEHGNVGGQSSIVFKSKINAGSDYAYINYQDDKVAGGGGESNILTIGTMNDADDHLALMPSGNVGIGTQAPIGKLDIVLPNANGGWNRFVVKPTTLWGDGVSTPTENGPAESSYVTIGTGNAGIMLNNPHIVWNNGNGAAALRYGRSGGISTGRWWEAGVNGGHGFHIRTEASPATGLEIGLNGNVGLGTTIPYGKLHLYETTGTLASTWGGTLTLEHGNQGGQSSIVFRSKNNGTSDFGYIAFQDDKALGGAGESNLLIIGTQNDQDDHIALVPSGNVGIKTYAPIYPLHVAGSRYSGVFSGNGAFVNPDTFYNQWDNNVAADLGIYADASIGTRGYFFTHQNFINASDARIKNVLSRSNPQEDLSTLCDIQVTNYTHIDKSMDQKVQKKLIAQELEEVFPQAVSQRKEFIPNIYAMATETQLNGEKLEITLAQKHGLKSGDFIELIIEKGQTKQAEVLSVDEYKFTIWSNEIHEQVFVYGKQVDDFRVIDYNSVFMLTVSSIQALNAEINALKKQVADLTKTTI